MFESGEEPKVSTGLGIMNELVVPCIPLLLAQEAEKDLLAVEDMRNRWCSYLGQEMEGEPSREVSGGLNGRTTEDAGPVSEQTSKQDQETQSDGDQTFGSFGSALALLSLGNTFSCAD